MQDTDGGSLFRRVERIFENLFAGDTLCKASSGALDAVSTAALVYGELTTPRRLFDALQLTREDTFVDLGSGRAQVVLAAAHLEDESAPNMSVGIELVQTRHEVAEKALHRCDDAVQARTRLICGDALAHDVSSCTKVFLCNATWGGELTDRFAAALSPSRAPLLQRVATIASFSENAMAQNDLALTEVSAVAATWAPSGTALYVYSRAPSDGSKIAPSVNTALLNSVMEERRAHAVRGRESGLASDGEMERGLLRTAMMAAAIADLAPRA